MNLTKPGIGFWEKAGFIFLCMAVFLMPFPRSWTLYPLGLAMATGLVLWTTDFKNLIKSLILRKWLILPLVSYFLVIFLNFLFRNPKWSFIEGYFMFLLVPLFLFPIFISEYFDKRSEIFGVMYISGIIIIFFFELAVAATGTTLIPHNSAEISFDPESFSSPFISQRLSFIEHPTYLGLKTLFALSLLIISLRETIEKKAWIVVLSAVLLSYIYLLSSRTIYLACGLLVAYFIVLYLKGRKARFTALIILPVMAVAVFWITCVNPRTKAKFDAIKQRYAVQKLSFKDLDPRLTSWLTASDLIKRNPVLGVGLDSRNILASEYQKNGYHNEASLRLNAHNQFLETQMALGMPGTVLLLLILVAPLVFTGFLRSKYLYYAFLLVVLATFMFESVLERQWGIMFFTVFYCYLVTKPGENN